MPIPATPDEPGRRVLMHDRVYEPIKEAILAGVLLPGERLREAELRRWLHVSGTPVRQALQMLAIEGFVETAPQSHTTVASPRPDLARDHLQTVGALVTTVSSLVVPHLDETERTELAHRLRATAAAIDAGDYEAGSAGAEGYYVALLTRCPNAVLARTTQQIAVSLSYQIKIAREGLDANFVTLAHAYRDLADGLERNDADAIDAATRRTFALPAPHAGG